jgi:hypothetical protein
MMAIIAEYSGRQTLAEFAIITEVYCGRSTEKDTFSFPL